MKLSPAFLKSLQQKLAVESRRGVHLNAIPGRSRLKFDLQRLALFQPSLPQDFLDTLLTKTTFEFPIAVPLDTAPSVELERAARQLNLLQYEVEDILSEKGIHTFGFGYPLVMRRDDKGKWIVAPLLIWSLQISRTAKKGQWILKRMDDDPVVVNEVLLRYLQKETAVVLDGLQDWIREDEILSAEQIEEIVTYFLEKMGQVEFATAKKKRPLSESTDQLFEIGLQQIPERASLLGKKEKQLQLHQGGLFAVFEIRHQNLIRDYDQLLKEKSITVDLESKGEDSVLQLGSVRTDPAQQAILNALSAKKSMVIHGPPGTGKSQTLTAIIVNALTKGQRVLVVCGKQTALQVIMEHLEKMDLDHLAALIKEVKKDRRQVVNKVRQVVDERTFYAGEGALFSTNDFENMVAHGAEKIAEQSFIQALYEKHIWGTHTIGDLVALLLSIPDGLRFEAFAADQFIEEEDLHFEKWKSKTIVLQKGEPLYQSALPYLGDYFLATFSAASFMGLETRLDKGLTQLKQQIEEVERCIFTFENDVQIFYSKKYEQVYHQLNQQIDLVQNYLSKPKHKSTASSDTLTKEQTYGLQYYSQICDFIAEEEGLDYEPDYTQQPKEVLDELSKIKSILNDWKRSWRDNIDQIISSLGIKNMPDELEELSAYILLQRSLEDLIDGFNEAKWFKEETLLQDSALDTIEEVQQKIEQLIWLKKNGLIALHNWASFYFNQTPDIQKILNALLKETNWKAQYDASVFNKVLKREHQLKHPSRDGFSFNQWQEDLEKHQIAFLQRQWRERQRVASIRFQQQQRLEVAQFYNKRSTSTQKKHSLRDLVARDLELFQSFFPVVLTTPESASLLFSEFGSQEIFDLVLFDEASQLKVEEGIPAFLKGHQKIVAGDEHQMPPSTYFGESSIKGKQAETSNDFTEIPSWLDFVSNLPVAHHYLDFHYRSRHPALIAFSNAAFYEDRLCPMPPQIEESPISFRMVSGVYTEGLNEAESDDVVLLLRKIKRNEDGFYPSVGIATFNVKQRNLILEKLRTEETTSPSFAAKMIALREGGLFVKNLENIQGDERDLLIISTVYGKGENGKFSERFGPINQKGGYKLLNVLITRAKFKIIVCCSVPKLSFNSYDKYLKRDGNTRKGVFYAWLSYAKAVSEEDSKQIEQVLIDLRKYRNRQDTESVHNVRNSLFPSFVFDGLGPKLKEGSLTLDAKIGGFSIDILYESVAGLRYLIICDGVNENEITSGLGGHPSIRIIRIWSTDWWRGEEEALDHLYEKLVPLKLHKK